MAASDWYTARLVWPDLAARFAGLKGVACHLLSMCASCVLATIYLYFGGIPDRVDLLAIRSLIKYLTSIKLLGEVGMAVPKSNGTRVGWRLRMQWSILCYTISPSFHFGSQNNVAGMLHCVSSLQPTLVPLLFGTAIPTYPNNFL